MAERANTVWNGALWRRVGRAVAVASAFVVGALVMSFPLQRWIGYPFVFLFFGAIMASAWVGDAAAGVVAVVLSSLAANYFFIPPVYSITVAKEAQSFFAAFILCALVLAMVSSWRRRAEQLVRAANGRLEQMVRARTAELERSNRELAERERHLRELTEAIPQQIWRANAAGEIEYLNRNLRGYLGEQASADVADLLERTVHPQDEPLVRAAWAQARQAGERFEVAARVRSAAGAYRWFLIRGNPQRSSRGEIALWYGTHIDIEEQRRAQQGLVSAQEERTRLEKNLTLAEMAASIAHELNQPLTAVVTHAYACREWLRNEQPNLERAKATAERIVEESTRASDVVRRVRALFRKESPSCLNVSLGAVLEEQARLLREEAIRRNATIRLEVAEGLPEIEADPVLLQQVVRNLALNGLEAMDETAEARVLTIGAKPGEPGEVRIWVEDRGPGVSGELQMRIFEPFFSTKTDGIGMGLAICRSIVEALGGRIAVENLACGGARFQFNLRASQ